MVKLQLQLIFVFLLLCPLCSKAQDKVGCDSVLHEVFAATEIIHNNTLEYQSEFYLRNYLHAKKRNLTCLLLPNADYFMYKGRELLREDCGKITYDNHLGFEYDMQLRNSSEPGEYMDNEAMMFMFNVHPYKDFILDTHFISPLLKSNSKYYRYQLDSICGDNVYFSYKARRRNTQTVTGGFVYSRSTKRITSLRFRGRYGFYILEENVAMGSEGNEMYLPVKIDVNYKYIFFFNHYDGKALFTQKFENVGRELNNLNFGDLPQDEDSLKIASCRTMPLDTLSERVYYEGYVKNVRHDDSIKVVKKKSSLSKVGRGMMDAGEFLVRSHNISTSNNSDMHFSSPNINWSPSKGFTVREDMDYEVRYSNGKRLHLRPSIGYDFDPHEWVAGLKFNYEYKPKYGADLFADFGVRPMSIGADRISVVGQTLDTYERIFGEAPTLTFSDTYLNIGNKVELFNGFFLSVGAIYHLRRPFHMSTEDKEFLGIDNNYQGLAFRATTEFTPGLKYYERDSRKVAMDNGWPTITLDYEKSIKGVFGSLAEYERWEAMASCIIRSGHMRKMMLKVGGGMFTNQDNMDFTTYQYFNNGVTDYNWDDDFTGVFQLLDSKYYYNSQHYLRGHLVYDSPTIFLRNVNTYIIKSERLYASALLTEGLVPYVELGYGVSTHLVNVSLFFSYINNEPLNVEAKFSINILK